LWSPGIVPRYPCQSLRPARIWFSLQTV